nr:hypothetical protein BaRGS_011537 [Batillaria attramentaria]
MALQKNDRDDSSLTGSPPDLVLNVSLDNVQEADDGFWSLILTNDEGTGHEDFRLKVEPAPASKSLKRMIVRKKTVQNLQMQNLKMQNFQMQNPSTGKSQTNQLRWP